MEIITSIVNQNINIVVTFYDEMIYILESIWDWISIRSEDQPSKFAMLNQESDALGIVI